jgi:hypothetical protein
MSDIKICPECLSDSITELTTYNAVVGRNVKTGKIICRDKSPENGSPIFWTYRCRKCGWDSDCFVE